MHAFSRDGNSTQLDNVAAVMAVGDTPLDLQAANNAGLRGMVGVLSREGSGEQLRREPHTNLLASVTSLPALLDRNTDCLRGGLGGFFGFARGDSACNRRFLARRLIFCLRRRWKRAVSRKFWT